jgi:GMP synthase (glutamine-hydrolysing)
MSHGDEVDDVPDKWLISAKSSNGVTAAVEHKDRPLFGTQFHPEVIHTEEGKRILRNFLFSEAQCTGDWKPASFVNETIEKIRQQGGR